jgi:putative transcriptional regulator
MTSPQETSTMLGRGRLLVASPRLKDPNFWRTVVLLLEQGEEGALGVVLNRPTETTLDGPLPGWEGAAASPGVVFVGGPVQPEVAIALGSADGVFAAEEASGWREVVGPIGTIDLEMDPLEASIRFRGVRVFAGYSGWGPGQLEGEVEAGAWFVMNPTLEDVFSARPEEMWSQVLRRQGGSLSYLANYPLHPSLN